MIRFSFPGTINTDPAIGLLDKIAAHPMGGWLNWPAQYLESPELAEIKSAAANIQQNSDYLVCIGIGGSYLGHRALIEALGNRSQTKILYIGNTLDPAMIERTLAELEGHSFSINVISKSGTTLEPAIAYRIFRQRLIEQYGLEEAYRRIYITTDAHLGALRQEAEAHHCTSFTVPDHIGGRYSVLTAVGLLPAAVAGLDIDELLAGAAAERNSLSDGELLSHPTIQYACLRQQLVAEKGCDVEVLASFSPLLLYFGKWWEQLFGESEGKNGQGIFPAAAIYSADLHSLGQFMQDGRRNIFETMLYFDSPNQTHLTLPPAENPNELSYLEHRDLNDINRCALDGTIKAHRDGGLPVSLIIAPDLSERSLGALIFFFETACALSAMISGVDPFDQPGVEAYKAEMRTLLTA